MLVSGSPEPTKDTQAMSHIGTPTLMRSFVFELAIRDETLKKSVFYVIKLLRFKIHHLWFLRKFICIDIALKISKNILYF